MYLLHAAGTKVFQSNSFCGTYTICKNFLCNFVKIVKKSCTSIKINSEKLPVLKKSLTDKLFYFRLQRENFVEAWSKVSMFHIYRHNTAKFTFRIPLRGILNPPYWNF